MPYKDPNSPAAIESKRKRAMKYYWKNRDKEIEKMRVYRLANPEYFKRKSKERYADPIKNAERREYSKKYRRLNPDYFREYDKKYGPEYREQNRDKLNEYGRVYRKLPRVIKKYFDSREERMVYQRAYYHKRKEFWREYYRARENSKRSKIGVLDKSVLQMVYEDNIKKYGTLTCCLCQKSIGFGEDSLEHLLPISRGGTNEYHNLAVAHLICNIQKNNKTVEEYENYKKEIANALAA